MGSFWGAERLFWPLEGVIVTAAGFSGGTTRNPVYDQVTSGRTGHAQVVRVVFDPRRVSFEDLLAVFWEGHDATQGMRQGEDVGTQYRSAIFTTTEAQRTAAEASRARQDAALAAAGLGRVTTEIRAAGPFYLAEEYHQQYLAKTPDGYRGQAPARVRHPREERAPRSG
jgi:peptide-methionine (S)-S-oxide reductase